VKPSNDFIEAAEAARDEARNGGSSSEQTPGVVEGDATPILINQQEMVPGRGPWEPAYDGELYEGTAKDLTNLKNSQSWLTSLAANDPEGYGELIGYLRAAGQISDRTDVPTAATVANATRQLLSEAGAAGQEFYSFVQGRYGDPVYLMDGLTDGSSSGSGGGGRAPRMPSRTETVQETNEMDANVLLNNAMQQAVGRDATEAEVQAFTRILNGEAEANPRFTQSNPVGMNDAKNRTGGGINTELLAAEFADGTPGAPEYKMATEGMEALEGWFAKKIGVF